MDREIAELKRLYQMLGTVATQQYAEQIQKVCTAFYEAGRATNPQIPDFKTEEEFEHFMQKVWEKYKAKLYRDGLRAGAEAQQNAVEATLMNASGEKFHKYDIAAILLYLRGKIPHD